MQPARRRPQQQRCLYARRVPRAAPAGQRRSEVSDVATGVKCVADPVGGAQLEEAEAPYASAASQRARAQPQMPQQRRRREESAALYSKKGFKMRCTGRRSESEAATGRQECIAQHVFKAHSKAKSLPLSAAEVKAADRHGAGARSAAHHMPRQRLQNAQQNTRCRPPVVQKVMPASRRGEHAPGGEAGSRHTNGRQSARCPCRLAQNMAARRMPRPCRQVTSHARPSRRHPPSIPGISACFAMSSPTVPVFCRSEYTLIVAAKRRRQQ